jgi:hypothetical protein
VLDVESVDELNDDAAPGRDDGTIGILRFAHPETANCATIGKLPIVIIAGVIKELRIDFRLDVRKGK